MGLFFSILTAALSGPLAGLFSKTDPELIEMVRRGLPWFVVPISLFGVTGTMAHYFLSVHQPRSAAILLLGRQVLVIPMFVVFPRLLGFSGIYVVGPVADTLFLVIAATMMVRELAKLRHAM
jgi:Na+-driven multidrug efflux pump